MAHSRRRIAIIGSGIAGMGAAWLLAQAHDVTLFEANPVVGGHSRTLITPQGVPVDTGFIVYNEATYPNLVALFKHLDVPTRDSDMSFAVSLAGGRREYATTDLASLVVQPANLLRPRFWSMIRDLLRFYREAPVRAADLERDLVPLGEFLQGAGYGAGFVEDHLLPMAAAIWSVPAAEAARYPATAFIRFCENHGLLKISNRPVWRTVAGGSREYVSRITAPLAGNIRTGCPVRRIERTADGVLLWDGTGEARRFDDVVLATHAPQALALLGDASDSERTLLGAMRTAPNRVVLHRDPRLMPRRRAAWSSWNYIGLPDGGLCVTYWLDRLQGLKGPDPHFVTLNPPFDPADTLDDAWLNHPMFDAEALRAQRLLWSLQGRRNTWFCGAWFGAGFHEDGLQSGLAVAEQLGGVRRPWSVPAASSRIHLEPWREAA